MQVELPSADLDCSLSQYVDIICSELCDCIIRVFHDYCTSSFDGLYFN